MNGFAKVDKKRLESEALSPVVKGRIRTASVFSSAFLLRVDTGSDLTMVPSRIIDEVRPNLYRRPIDIMLANGDVVKGQKAITCYINIEGLAGEFFPPDGVLPTKSRHGILGMDILSECVLFLDSGKGVLARIQ